MFILNDETAIYHDIVGGELAAASDKYIYDFSYDAGGRLVGSSYEGYGNGTDMDDQFVAAMTYDESGTGASGSMETFSLDEITGNLTSDGPAKTISYTFAAGAPTAAMAVGIQQFPYESNEIEPFEELSLTIDMPALFGLYFLNSTMSADFR